MIATALNILGHVLWVALYLGIGLAIARTLSKSIYRSKRQECKSVVAATTAYHAALAGWVFLWPARTLAFLIYSAILYLIVLPVQSVISWGADVAKAPVATQLRTIQDTWDEITALTKTIRDDKTPDEELAIAESGLQDAYRKQDAACADLGIQLVERPAITAGSVDQDSIDRASKLAEDILRKVSPPPREQVHPHIHLGATTATRRRDFWAG